MAQEKRDKIIKIRVAETEKQVISEKARQANVDISSYMRQQALDDTKRMPLDIAQDTVSILGKIASQLNYQAHQNTDYKQKYKELHMEAMRLYGIIESNHK